MEDDHLMREIVRAEVEERLAGVRKPGEVREIVMDVLRRFGNSVVSPDLEVVVTKGERNSIKVRLRKRK